MKRILLCFLLVVVGSSAKAQVGIGTTTPNATLEISNSENGGVLIPSYSLNSDTDPSPVVEPQLGGNPEDGTMVFNTNAAATNLDRGFVHWDGGQWNMVGKKTGVMFRKISNNATPNLVTLPASTGAAFNFATEVYNNISGTSYDNSSNRLTLPRGLYKITSSLRMSNSGTMDYNIRLGGTILASSSVGSMTASARTSSYSDSPHVAIVEITAASDFIDFKTLSSNTSRQVEGNQCFLMIEKIQ